MTVSERRRGPRRLWVVAVVLALGALGVGFVWYGGQVYVEMRTFAAFLVVLATGLLLTLWWTFLSGVSWKARLLGLLVPAVLVGAPAATLRIDGVTGDIIPQLSFRWQKKKDQLLADLPDPAESAAAVAVPEGARDFPEFLGAGRRNVVSGVVPERDWQKHPPRQLWRQPIGAGWSQFVVAGGRAVTQEQRGDNELVSCYELATGKVLWSHRDAARFSEVMGGDGPRATPTLHDGKVYALGATGILNCLDLESGKLVWSHNVLEEHKQGNLEWAKSCSPLIVEDLVVVTLGQGPEPSVAAYDRASGKPVWTSGHGKASYASPVLAKLAGRRQLLVVNAASVTGHDPADGKVLWEHAWPGDFAKCSNAVPIDDNHVFLSAGYPNMGCQLVRVEAASDGSLSAAQVWKKPYLKTRFTNVALRDGFVYGLDDGVLACLEAKTGALKWKDNRDGRYGHGQVLLVEDVLLVVGEEGEVALVEAKPDGFNELTRIQGVKGKTWNNPALAGRYLLVRNAEEAACYAVPLKQAP